MLIWVAGGEEVHLWLLLPGDALDGVEARLGIVLLGAVDYGNEVGIRHRDMVGADANQRTMLTVELDCCEMRRAFPDIV